MNRYKCLFYGRPLGAIGMFSLCCATVDAEKPKDARLELYKDFEHILGLRMKVLVGEEWKEVTS